VLFTKCKTVEEAFFIIQILEGFPSGKPVQKDVGVLPLANPDIYL